MSLDFTKMHGLGNDFMVIDAVRQKIRLTKEEIISLAKRDTGIGFDQCLLVEPSKDNSADFFYRIFNADGQEVGQCGNGARCLARFVHFYGLTDKKQITVATKTTCLHLKLNEDDSVTVDFATPSLAPERIPLHVNAQNTVYPLPLQDGTLYPVHAISVGNPHAVTIVQNTQQVPVAKLGKEISEHLLFPEQTNVGFMEIIDHTHINLRVYERGCGETRACGSGAVAAAAIGRLFYELAPKVDIKVLGGILRVDWPKLDGPISLTGPASFVYEGKLCQTI